VYRIKLYATPPSSSPGAAFPKAVMRSVERHEALTRTSLYLGALTREFDALVASMQTPGAGAAARDLFSAASEDLGRAAVGAALRTS
jgi:hypothetical protein